LRGEKSIFLPLISWEDDLNRREFVSTSLAAAAGATLFGRNLGRAAADPNPADAPASDAKQTRFPDGFLWGTATAAFQV
jgi:beta-glucosidase